LTTRIGCTAGLSSCDPELESNGLTILSATEQAGASLELTPLASSAVKSPLTAPLAVKPNRKSAGGAGAADTHAGQVNADASTNAAARTADLKTDSFVT
jgi:hypothetical protein